VQAGHGRVHGRLSMPHRRNGHAHVRDRRVDDVEAGIDVLEAGILAREGPAHVRHRCIDVVEAGIVARDGRVRFAQALAPRVDAGANGRKDHARRREARTLHAHG
jgi:hypothetical protein